MEVTGLSVCLLLRLSPLLASALPSAITPTAETAAPDGSSIFLGGYGFGPVRPSTGVLDPILPSCAINVSSKIGDHIQCALLAAAEDIGFAVVPDEALCAQYITEDPQVLSVGSHVIKTLEYRYRQQ